MLKKQWDWVFNFRKSQRSYGYGNDILAMRRFVISILSACHSLKLGFSEIENVPNQSQNQIEASLINGESTQFDNVAR